MSDEITDAIETNATGPAKASSEVGSVEQHSLTDQIAADRYLNSKAAARSRRSGLKLTKFVPPGTTE